MKRASTQMAVLVLAEGRGAEVVDYQAENSRDVEYKRALWYQKVWNNKGAPSGGRPFDRMDWQSVPGTD